MASALPPLTPGPHRARLGVISIVACFGGLLFGGRLSDAFGRRTMLVALAVLFFAGRSARAREKAIPALLIRKSGLQKTLGR